MKHKNHKIDEPHEMPVTIEMKTSMIKGTKPIKVGDKYKMMIEVEHITQSKGYDDGDPETSRFKVFNVRLFSKTKNKININEMMPERQKVLKSMHKKAYKS